MAAIAHLDPKMISGDALAGAAAMRLSQFFEHMPANSILGYFT